jgi:hypothetical protein
MPLPLLWRRADAVAALRRVGATALIVSGRIGTVDHFALAQEIAAEIFPIRYVCGYGPEAPDGVVPLDDIFLVHKLDPIPAWEEERGREPGPGAHLAVITWDVSPEGLFPVGRSHAELIAGGLAVMLESSVQQDAALLSTLTLSSFAGLAITILPWLLTGGTLALHHPFDAEVLLRQLGAAELDAVLLPGPLATQLAERIQDAGISCPSMVGVWRTPERLSRAVPWRAAGNRMTDVMVFGETGLLAACRGPSGKPDAIRFGIVKAPRAQKAGIVAGEIRPTAAGTVAMRGPMVPRAPFPPGAERGGSPYFKIAANGFVDTGYGCRSDIGSMIVTGPPPGMVSVGGYRFMLAQVQELVGGINAAPANIAVLPDGFAGHRLVGAAADVQAVQEALALHGANPLLGGAFREKPPATEEGRRNSRL